MAEKNPNENVEVDASEEVDIDETSEETHTTPQGEHTTPQVEERE